jgi:hypothetical protein
MKRPKQDCSWNVRGNTLHHFLIIKNLKLAIFID